MVAHWLCLLQLSETLWQHKIWCEISSKNGEMTTRWRPLVWGRGCSQRHVRWFFRSNAFLIERSSVLSSSHAVDLSPEVEEGGFRQELYHGAAVGLLWPSAAVGRPGPVSCGVTNVGRQRQGGGGRRPIAREPHAARLGSGPPLYAVAARYLPTTCAAVRGPSGPNLLFWRESSPQILLMRCRSPL